MEEIESLKNKILKEIKSGKVKMRPRFHFILRAGLWVFGTVMVFVLALYLTSFVFFVLARSGLFLLPGFGFRGVMAFLLDFPWLLILVAIVFIIFLEILVRHYSFAYKRPLFYSVLGVVGLVLFLGFVVRTTSFHSGLFRQAGEGRLPFVGGLYRSFEGGKFRNIHPGLVLELGEKGFILEMREGEEREIVFDVNTIFLTSSSLDVGDAVVVFGGSENGVVRAFGVREIEDLEDFLSGPPRRMMGPGLMLPPPKQNPL